MLSEVNDIKMTLSNDNEEEELHAELTSILCDMSNKMREETDSINDFTENMMDVTGSSSNKLMAVRINFENLTNQMFQAVRFYAY